MSVLFCRLWVKKLRGTFASPSFLLAFLYNLSLDITANSICEIHYLALDGFNLNTIHKLSSKEKKSRPSYCVGSMNASSVLCRQWEKKYRPKIGTELCKNLHQTKPLSNILMNLMWDEVESRIREDDEDLKKHEEDHQEVVDAVGRIVAWRRWHLLEKGKTVWDFILPIGKQSSLWVNCYSLKGTPLLLCLMVWLG